MTVPSGRERSFSHRLVSVLVHAVVRMRCGGNGTGVMALGAPQRFPRFHRVMPARYEVVFKLKPQMPSFLNTAAVAAGQICKARKVWQDPIASVYDLQILRWESGINTSSASPSSRKCRTTRKCENSSKTTSRMECNSVVTRSHHGWNRPLLICYRVISVGEAVLPCFRASDLSLDPRGRGG